MTIKANFPAIKPSLNLDFANSKVLDPRITFSRASTATYYDGKTTVKAEENLWYPSNDGLGGNVEVTKTANAAVAPDGTTTALLIVPSTVTGNHLGGYKSFPVVDAVAFFSFYAKASGYDKVHVGDIYLGRIYGTFDLTALSVTASGGPSYLDSGIIDVGNGWRRCWIKYNNVGSPGFAPAVTPIPTGATVNNYGQVTGTGDGTSGVYFWGFQVEQRSALTALTQTTTAPITNRIPALQTAAANVARFDHDPVTGESKGLLIEEQRTNLLTYSSAFDNAAWGKSGTGLGATPSITAKAYTAPDGLLTADRVVLSLNGGTASTDRSMVTQVVTSLAVGATYTASMFFKATSPSEVGKVLLFRHVAGSTYTQVTLTDTWTRVSISEVAGGSSGTVLLELRGTYGSASTIDFLVWGAQLEAGAFPTSYIPTTTAQVTRSADSASITGTNFSSWYRQGEGTFFSEGNVENSAAVVKTFVGATDGTLSNRILTYASTASPLFLVTTSGVAQASASGSVLLIPAQVKIAVGYSPDYCAASFNGSPASVDTSAQMPVLSVLGVGSYNGNGPLNGTIKRIAYYPKRLSNAELQALTA